MVFFTDTRNNFPQRLILLIECVDVLRGTQTVVFEYKAANTDDG